MTNEAQLKNDVEEQNPWLSRGVYLLPNLLTTTCLFFGFFAIISSMKGHFASVPWIIFIAMLADALDGRVARLTNTQTSFGANYDSLADLIAFGVAPAIFVYSWGLYELGKFGWLIAFFYVAATALRLARFNTQAQSNKVDKRYFQGLACTSAAGFVTGVVWMLNIYELNSLFFILSAAIITVLAGIFMVSSILYRSFKDNNFKYKLPHLAALFIIVLFVLIALRPPQVLAAIFFIYAFSGPYFSLVKFLKKTVGKKNRKKV